MSKTHASNPPAPIALSFEAIDELIYDARLGDLDALKEEISKWSRELNTTASIVIRSALDTEDESEGGTGACLLHWPAANGNIELLKYLLETLKTTPDGNTSPSNNLQEYGSFVNYHNYTGNTPLHWAALNTHLDCAKALVEAGADISLKNDAGHDAIFLAEQADWSGTYDENDDENEEQEEEEAKNNNEQGEIEIEIGGATGDGQQDAEKSKVPVTKAREVVEWLLSCDKGAELERPVAEQGDAQMEDAQ